MNPKPDEVMRLLEAHHWKEIKDITPKLNKMFRVYGSHNAYNQPSCGICGYCPDAFIALAEEEMKRKQAAAVQDGFHYVRERAWDLNHNSQVGILDAFDRACEEYLATYQKGE